MLRISVCLLCAALLSAPAAAGEAGQPADEASAKAAFEVAYEAGTAAAIAKKWGDAAKLFDAALKALGDYQHPKKAVAVVLLNKAREVAKQENAGALTPDQPPPVEEKKPAAAGTKPAPAVAPPPVMPPPVAEKKEAAATPAAVPALEVPEPGILDREQWFRGGGSACYWEGDRLHLEEGDEYFKKTLTKDFAAAIAIEADMTHRSQISIELRPLKDSGSTTRITGWGSKAGSPPMLMADKEVKATGDARPPREQITLAFVRTDRKIEFYCNGKLIGHTQDAKLGQACYLWVCGKGIMDGAKVVER